MDNLGTLKKIVENVGRDQLKATGLIMLFILSPTLNKICTLSWRMLISKNVTVEDVIIRGQFRVHKFAHEYWFGVDARCVMNDIDGQWTFRKTKRQS